MVSISLVVSSQKSAYESCYTSRIAAVKRSETTRERDVSPN